jgi:Tol biopolymer transport system component
MSKQLLRFMGITWLVLFLVLITLRTLGSWQKIPLIAFLSEGRRNTDVSLGDSVFGLTLQMTNSRSHEEDLSWSPDGRYLMFDLWDVPDGDIWLLDSDTWDIREMSLGEFTYAFWHSKNEIIVVINRTSKMHLFNVETQATSPYEEEPPCEGCYIVPHGTRLTAYDLDFDLIGEELHVQLVTSSYISSRYFEPNTDLQPWSPDGSSFLFITELQGQPDLYWSRAEGGIARRLTNSPSPEQMPRWSSDGLKISYVAYDEGNPEVYIMELATGYRYNLSRQESRDYNAVWQPIP